MIKLSRRALAGYAADQLINGQPIAKLAQQLAAVLAESDRSKDIDFLFNDINSELEQRGEVVTAQVTSARPISKKLLTDLKTQIKRATDVKRVQFNQTIDKAVLGGVKIESANSVWDQTAKRKLADLREAF